MSPTSSDDGAGEILISDTPRTGRNALLWRDSDQVWAQTLPAIPAQAATAAVSPASALRPMPFLGPLIDWRDHRPPPLMIRLRIRLARLLLDF